MTGKKTACEKIEKMRLELWVNWGSQRKAQKTRSESWISEENKKSLKGILDTFLFLMLEGGCRELGREKIC